MFRRTLATIAVFMLMASSLVLVSTVDGAAHESFSDNVLVSWEDPHQFEQRNPSLAVGPDGNISVVWEGYDTHGYPFIYYALSSDGGESFSNATAVSPGGGEQWEPKAAVNGTGTIFIVWAEQTADGPDLMLSVSNDSGSNFSAPLEIAPSTSGQLHPDIAVWGDLVMVTWTQENGSSLDIMAARSVDGGASFQTPVRVDGGGSSEMRNYPSIAARNGSVFVAWHDGSPGDIDIYGVWSNDSGEGFLPPVEVSDGMMDQSRPDVAFIPDGNVTAVWQDEGSGDMDIRCSVSYGLEFRPSVLVNLETAGDQSCPSVAVDSKGNISVVFKDESGGTPHITWALSRDGGESFSSGVRVDDRGDVAIQGAPDVAVGNDTPMVVFDDLEADDWDIYFSKMLNFPPLVNITSPSEGAVVKDIITIRGNATDPDDNDTLLVVEVRISGDVCGTGWMETTGGDNWSLEFNTSELMNGEFVVDARSYDGSAYSGLAAVTVTVDNEVQLWPDLAIEGNITFSPSNLQMMQPTIVRVEVTNLGNVSAHDVQVKFTRSNVQMGEMEVIPLLEPGEIKAAFITWMALEGLHTIRVEVDPDDLIMELDEGNNMVSEQVQVMPAGYYSPDLNITSDDIEITPPDLKDGDEAQVTVTVRNDGRINASSVKVLLIVDGVEVANGTLDSVPMNGTGQITFNWMAVTGEHQIMVEVIPISTGELDESNNNASVSLEVAFVESFPGWYLLVTVMAVLLAAVVIVAVIRKRRK